MRRVCPTGRRDTFSPRTWDQGSLCPELRLKEEKVLDDLCRGSVVGTVRVRKEKWYISDKNESKKNYLNNVTLACDDEQPQAQAHSVVLYT